MEGFSKKFIAWAKLKIRIHLAKQNIFFKERENWWASIGMNIGFEQNGKNETFERPVLILKKFNLDIMWIIPMTSQEKFNNQKFYFPIKYKNETSYLILSQLRLISNKRLLRKVRTLPREEFNDVRRKIKNFLKKNDPCNP